MRGDEECRLPAQSVSKPLLAASTLMFFLLSPGQISVAQIHYKIPEISRYADNVG